MAADKEDVLEAIRAALAPSSVSRYADWDEAVAQRKPLRFRFLGRLWQLKEVDFRSLGVALSPAFLAGCDDTQAAEKVLGFLGELVTEPEAWREATSAGAGATIALSTALGGIAWIVRKEASMPLEIADGDDPLERPAASSPSASGTGRSSAGGSHKRASRTR